MTIIKILLIAAALGLLVLLVRNHGTNRASALTKIWLTLFLLFAIYAVIRPGDVSWVAAQLGVGRGTDLVLYLLVVTFGYFGVFTYLRFKELQLRFATLARAFALLDAAVRESERRIARMGADAAADGGPIDDVLDERGYETVRPALETTGRVVEPTLDDVDRTVPDPQVVRLSA
ncbi:MAG TPA: DUF2304 domain-containing protein [Nakamurella multipartita]|nr:DUF2304 domain-containing protein [Nakamurella multipartita]